ncbi:putative ribonuclease H-like domain-containing protein [Tanacetum coccineum]
MSTSTRHVDKAIVISSWMSFGAAGGVDGVNGGVVKMMATRRVANGEAAKVVLMRRCDGEVWRRCGGVAAVVVDLWWYKGCGGGYDGCCGEGGGGEMVTMASGGAVTTLLQSIPDDHVADFHYMDDAMDIWNAVKARFGGNVESKKMRKSMLKQEFSEFRISEAEGLHKGSFASSWSQPEQQLAYKDFDRIEKLDLEEMDLKWQMAMFSVRVHKFEQKAGRKIDFDKKESARFNKKKVRCYKCLQRVHFARECRAKGGNDKQRYSSFKILEIGKKEEDSKALITVDTLVDWTDHDGQSDRVIASKEFGMIAGCDTEDAIEEGAAKIYNLITGADTKEFSTAGDAGEFALMGVTSETLSCAMSNYGFISDF